MFLHELNFVSDCVVKDDLDPSFKALRRIANVQDQMLGVWSVLATMTPSDYTTFRNALGRSSGFQSVQYRLMEFALGNKNADHLRVHQRDPEEHERLKRALHAPSLYDEALRLLSRRGYGIPVKCAIVIYPSLRAAGSAPRGSALSQRPKDGIATLPKA